MALPNMLGWLRWTTKYEILGPLAWRFAMVLSTMLEYT